MCGVLQQTDRIAVVTKVMVKERRGPKTKSKNNTSETAEREQGGIKQWEELAVV